MYFGGAFFCVCRVIQAGSAGIETGSLVLSVLFSGATSTGTTTQSATGTTTQSATGTRTQSATGTTTQSATATTTQSATATTTSCIVPPGTCESLGDGTWQTYDDLASRAEGRSSCWRSSAVGRFWPQKCSQLQSGAHLLTSRATAGQGLLGAIAAAGRGDGWVGAKGSSLADYDWVDDTPNVNIRRAAFSPVSAWARSFPRCGLACRALRVSLRSCPV
jgi:hypothetical protein